MSAVQRTRRTTRSAHQISHADNCLQFFISFLACVVVFTVFSIFVLRVVMLKLERSGDLPEVCRAFSWRGCDLVCLTRIDASTRRDTPEKSPPW